MIEPVRDAAAVAAAVSASGLTIADVLDTRPGCYYSVAELSERLRTLVGKELSGANRTRSRLAKQLVAEVLGYPAPTSFRRSVPRFPGQDLDVYVQTSDNLQIWNQQVDPARRYVLIRPVDGTVRGVVVKTGADLATWDRTGTLTGKRQAKRRPGRSGSACSPRDTAGLTPWLGDPSRVAAAGSVGEPPRRGQVLPIAAIHQRLQGLVGKTFADPGPGQERRRGEALQQLVVTTLDVGGYHNPAGWPDVPSQVLEVKLQTASTVDLGAIHPDSPAPTRLDPQISHRDVRWAVVYVTERPGGLLEVTEVVTTTGAAFTDEFQLFGGNGTNRKLQLRLPRDLFEPQEG